MVMVNLLYGTILHDDNGDGKSIVWYNFTWWQNLL